MNMPGIMMEPIDRNGSMLRSFLDERFWPWAGVYAAAQRVWPAVDVIESKDRFFIRADVPGLEEQNMRIEFADGVLVLEGSYGQADKPGEETRVHLRERMRHNFRRAFDLGDGVQPDKIQASLHDGTLTIEIPKAEKVVPRTIPIAVTKH